MQQHAATFIEQAEAAAGAGLPRQFVKDEFDAFLDCGILARGFVRLRCGDYGHDKLETAWRDGTTQPMLSPDTRQSVRKAPRLVKGPSYARARPASLSPLKFMQRLAALVPRPRLHLTRFHGLLAANAELRALVVPQEHEPAVLAAAPAECKVDCVHHCPVWLICARLLERVFALDLGHFPNCGGEPEIIAAILEVSRCESLVRLATLRAPRLALPPHPAPICPGLFVGALTPAVEMLV